MKTAHLRGFLCIIKIRNILSIITKEEGHGGYIIYTYRQPH